MERAAADETFTEALNYLLSARLLEAGGQRVMNETRALTIANYRENWDTYWNELAGAL